MNESEERTRNPELQKARIRERYKGIDPDELDVIPAKPQESFYEDTREKLVGAYVRVSTDDPRQTTSYELQKNHYEDLVTHHPGWKLAGIYADEGISGTSLQHRDAFLRMIEDCKHGKLNLIVTKSVSRFARNVVDCIKYVRELKALPSPVGVFFEAESIYTLDPNSEMSLSFISTLAQEESHNKSEIMNASIEMRFKRGIFLTPPLLGYDQDEDGNLVINEEEAKTVRLAFFMYLYGYSSQQIADTFTRLGRRTKKGNTVWSSDAIIQILQNERHCGDVLAHKTWTPSYLDHKAKKNRFNCTQYRQKNHHEAIVSRDDFIAVQHMISNTKYGNKGFLPELQVISEGILKGYVSVNPRWAGFSADDYRAASASVCPAENNLADLQKIEVPSGSFDLRGFELARAEFFNIPDKPAVTFTGSHIRFSAFSLKKFPDQKYVELLIHPGKMLLAVRPCTKNTRNAVQWTTPSNQSASICGMAYIPTLFSLFGWNRGLRYRVLGQLCQKESESFLLFNLKDTQISIPSVSSPKESPKGSSKSLTGYPIDWSDNFGDSYYSRQLKKEQLCLKENVWNSMSPSIPYKEPELKVTQPEEVARAISSMISDMKQEAANDTR